MVDPLQLRLDAEPIAVPRARSELRRWLAESGIDGAVREGLELCVSELVANVVVHARGDRGVVGVEAWLWPDRCALVVSDHGPGFRLDQAGIGLRLVAEMADMVTVDRIDGETTVMATFYVDRSA